MYLTVLQNGYITGTDARGSLSPTSLRGNTIDNVSEIIINGGPSTFSFEISDSSNPGKSYFTSLTINGDTYNSSNATYSYGSGVALWTWTPGTHGIPASGTVTMTIQ
jgi:hypothetical protein